MTIREYLDFRYDKTAKEIHSVYPHEVVAGGPFHTIKDFYDSYINNYLLESLINFKYSNIKVIYNHYYNMCLRIRYSHLRRRWENPCFPLRKKQMQAQCRQQSQLQSRQPQQSAEFGSSLTIF